MEAYEREIRLQNFGKRSNWAIGDGREDEPAARTLVGVERRVPTPCMVTMHW